MFLGMVCVWWWLWIQWGAKWWVCCVSGGWNVVVAGVGWVFWRGSGVVVVIDRGVPCGVVVLGVAYWKEESRPPILPSLAFFVFSWSGGMCM